MLQGAAAEDTAATWILEGDIQGFFDNITFSWLETHIPMNKRVLSKWLRSGFIDHGDPLPDHGGGPPRGDYARP